MTALIVWLLSFITFVGMESAIVFKITKDLADSGYKLNISKYSNILDDIKGHYEDEEEKSDTLRAIISCFPLINIMYAMYTLMDYEKNKNEFFNHANTMGCIEELSIEEKREYAKNKSGFKLLLFSSKLEADLKYSLLYNYQNENESGKIYYLLNLEEKIDIVKTEGDCIKFTEEEKITLIKNYQNRIKDLVKEEYTDRINYVLDDVIDDNKELVLEKNVEDKSLESFESLTNEEQIRLLKYIRYFILKDEYDKENAKLQEAKRLIKK